MVDVPDVRVVDPEQLAAEWETYPTEVICVGGLNVGVSAPTVVTVKAPFEGGQMYLSVPVPGVGPPLRTRVPLQVLDVTAFCEGMIVEGMFSVVMATAVPTNRIPVIISTSGLR